jgi:hypothetical protein
MAEDSILVNIDKKNINGKTKETLRLEFWEQYRQKYIITCVSDYRRGLDWMIGFINTLYNQLVLTSTERDRWFTQFTVHRYTRTRILRLH